MWTQRDQVQAYQFLRRRLVSALVSADANDRVSPSRRLVMGTVMGLSAVLLVAAGFGIAGVIHPSSDTSWKQGGQVIVESGTGARYVLGKDQRLHPVLNYASARLLAGGDGSKTVSVSASTLSSVPRGDTVGIPGAPDSLPATSKLVTGAWTVCSQSSPDQAAGAVPVTTLLLGVPPSGQTLGDSNGLVVSAGGVRYVVAGGVRYRLSADAATALGYDAATVLPAAPAWIGALPAGRTLALTGVAGAGGAGPVIGGRATRIGQVLRVSTLTATGSQAARLYLVRSSRTLAPIGATEAELVINGPSASAAGGPVTVRAADVAGHVGSAGLDDSGYPDAVPVPVRVAGSDPALCARTDPATDVAVVSVAASVPLPSGAATTPVTASGNTVADEVYVAPSAGALVAVQPAPSGPTGTRYLITDAGLRYAIDTSADQSALGYGSVDPVGVPPALIGLLATGPTLDQSSAQTVVSR